MHFSLFIQGQGMRSDTIHNSCSIDALRAGLLFEGSTDRIASIPQLGHRMRVVVGGGLV